MSLSLNFNPNPTAVKYNNQDCREVWWRPNEYSSYQRVWVCAEPFTVTATHNGVLGFVSYSWDSGILPTSGDQSDGFDYHYHHSFGVSQDTSHKVLIGFEDTSNAYIQATRTWNSANWAIEINPNMILTGRDGPNAPIKCKTVIYDYDDEDVGQLEENIIYMDPIKPTTIEYISLYNFNLLYNNGWNGSFRADNLSDGHGPKVLSIAFPDLVEIALKNGAYTGAQDYFEEFHCDENVIRNMSFRFKATIDGIGYHSDWLAETFDYRVSNCTFTMYPELD